MYIELNIFLFIQFFINDRCKASIIDKKLDDQFNFLSMIDAIFIIDKTLDDQFNFYH
jgi:hypothetical protein